MKTTVPAFDIAQSKSKRRHWKKVELYRRKWNSPVYDYDATPIDLTPYLKDCSKIKNKLDSEALNVWKSSNVTVTLSNEDNYWDETNAAGVWNGKIAFHSKIVISAGYWTSATAKVTVVVFTGMITEPIILRDQAKKPVAQVTVSGWEGTLRGAPANKYSKRPVNPEIQLTNADAPYNATTIKSTGAGWGINAYAGQMVRIYSGTGRSQERLIASNTADTLTIAPNWTTNPDATTDFEIIGEDLGDGDGSETQFTTTQPGVGRIDKVWIDGVEQTPGTDYEVRDLNNKTAGGIVEFTSAPALAEEVACDYIYWYQDIDPKTAIEGMLATAGWSSSDYAIAPILMPNNAHVIWEQATQAEFEAAGYSNNDSSTAVEPDVIRVGNLPMAGLSLKRWWPNYWHIEGAVFPDDAGYDTQASTDSTFVEPRWRHVALNGVNYQGASEENEDFENLIVETNVSDNDADWDGWVEATYAYYNWQGTFTGNPYETELWRFWGYWTVNSADKRYIKFRTKARPGYNGRFWYQDAFISFSPTGYHISAPRDCGATLKAFGRLITEHYKGTDGLQNYRGVKFFTRATDDDGGGSPDAGNWSSWEEVSPGGPIPTAVTIGTTQWLQIKTEVQAHNTQDAFPKVDVIKAHYYTAKFDLDLLNLTDRSVWDALIEISNLIDYEMGVSAAGVLFFRPKKKDVNEADFEITETQNMYSVKMKKYDYKRMRNVINVQYGRHLFRISPELMNEDSPHSQDKYGDQVFEISGGNLMSTLDTDLATGIGKHFFGNWDANGVFIDYKYPEPKEYVKVVCQCLLNLDLSDVVRVVRTYPGSSGSEFVNKLFVILGLSIDIMKWDLEIEGLEPY